MTTDEKKKLYAALAAPFPEDAIERTDGSRTGKGYSTTGIKYQYVVNRINEVLGVGGFRVERSVTTKEIQTSKGRPAHEATCEVKIQLGEWIGGEFMPFAEAVGDGGHVATALADAIKGAYTNGFKKTAAFLGVGRQAYEGTLDDDNVPAEEPWVRPQPTATKPEVRAPRPQAELPSSPAPVQATQPRQADGGAQPRNRLTSKQLSAIWAIARGRGLEECALRDRVVKLHGVQPEYLTRSQASDLIGSLTGNGHDHQDDRSVGEEG